MNRYKIRSQIKKENNKLNNEIMVKSKKTTSKKEFLTGKDLVKGKEYFIRSGPEKGVFIGKKGTDLIFKKNTELSKIYTVDKDGDIAFCPEGIFFTETSSRNE